jgi:hypothetical protein
MRLFVENQVWAVVVELFTFSCRVFRLHSVINKLVSSAYKKVFAHGMLRGRSFIYNKNSNGPRIDP